MKKSDARTKRVLSLVLGLVMVMGVVMPVMVYANNDISVTIDGERVNFEGQQPTLVDGRTLVPVRGVFEMLGFEVVWNSAASTAIITNASYTMLITIGSNVFTVNGAEHTLDVPAQSIGGRTMVPIRLPLESIGAVVNWESDTSTVVVTAPLWNLPTDSSAFFNPTLYWDFGIVMDDVVIMGMYPAVKRTEYGLFAATGSVMDVVLHGSSQVGLMNSGVEISNFIGGEFAQIEIAWLSQSGGIVPVSVRGSHTFNEAGSFTIRWLVEGFGGGTWQWFDITIVDEAYLIDVATTPPQIPPHQIPNQPNIVDGNMGIPSDPTIEGLITQMQQRGIQHDTLIDGRPAFRITPTERAFIIEFIGEQAAQGRFDFFGTHGYMREINGETVFLVFRIVD